MAQGMFRRAFVAIVMIATLLLPNSTCQPQSHRAGHDCCARDSAPASNLKADCCTFRNPIPAIVAERAVPNPNSFSTVSFLTPTAEAAVRFGGEAPIAAAHYSPPPGKTILRI